LRDNLVDALRGERVLVVLDNFETNLATVPTGAGYPCDEPEWDRLLTVLAERLPESRSRVLITCRHRIAALSDGDRALWVPLGPLPLPEAILFLQGHEALRALLIGGADDEALAQRVLEVSRGHPLILQRLGALAHDRPALRQALERIRGEGYHTLPDLFQQARTDAERERERRYLEDVAVGSVDLLIERAPPLARRLLWVVTLASEPVTEVLIRSIWSGQTLEQASAEDVPPVPPVGPLLAELRDAGLLAVEGGGDGTAYSFHELVRERAAARMEAHLEERGGRTAEQVWEAYGERYAAAFNALSESGKAGARVQAAEAGRRALSYLVRAGAFQHLGSFASGLVTGTRDSTLLRGVIAELGAVADQVPAGKDRWSVRTYLADALRMAGQPDQALPFYEQAAAEAEEAGAWRDVGAICQNWGNALGDIGSLDRARETYRRSADAKRKAGAPRVDVLGSELEALRIDIMQGGAEGVLPEIEKRLDEVRGWWQRHRSGEPVAEAPNRVLLGRALVGALDIADDANSALERWQACLDLIAESEEVERGLGEGEHELARTRANHYWPLLRLGRLDDAQRVLEGCLAVFAKVGDLSDQSRAITGLASVWKERGDIDQAVALERQALAISERLADPGHRSKSHINLASYLGMAGKAEEGAGHYLAALVYRVVTNNRQALLAPLHNIRVEMRRAAATGSRYDLPSLADLLGRPEFNPLRRFLADAGVSPPDLQPVIDQIIERARTRV
jgi:tetratricopeptide (TPR) repeat protein